MSDEQVSFPRPCDATREFADIILKACSFNPNERYKTIDDMLMDLSGKIRPKSNPTIVANTSNGQTPTGGNSTIYVGENNQTHPHKSNPTQIAGNDSSSDYSYGTKTNSIKPIVIAVVGILLIVGIVFGITKCNKRSDTSIVDSNTSHDKTFESELQSVDEITVSREQATQSTTDAIQNETEPITTNETEKTEYKISEIDYMNSSQKSGCFIPVNNQKDNVGNIYEYSVIQTNFADTYVDYEDFNEYYINQKYNRFSGTIFLLEEKKTYSSKMKIVIYGDEQVLYSTSVTGGFLPEDFDLDISNVVKLKISITGGNIDGIGTCIGIGNALLLTECQVGIVITENDDLNVRAKPSTESDIISTVPKGGSVKIVSEENDWYKIDINSRTGYVLKKYVSLNGQQTKGQSSSSVSQCLKKGTINSRGAKYVYSYTTDYVCNGGNKIEERLDLEHGWSVTAKNVCTAYDLTWYEVWDTDDGDYYGWVDSDFIVFE